MESTGRLYLFPVALSDGPLDKVLPDYNIRLISEIKYFIVENIRSARRFLKKCDKSIDISTLTFFVLNEQTKPDDVPEMISPLSEGHNVGVISEAGCPAVADPGALAVAAAHNRGFEVVPLVGPSSILLSVMGSGFNGQSFAFNGYLPIEKGARSTKLKDLERKIMRDDQTQIFIETPYRNNRLIAEITSSLPGHLKLCVASDLTGEHQKFDVRTISQWSHAKYDFDKIPTIFLLYK